MVSALPRRDAVRALLARRERALVVTGLGSPSYDVHALGDRDDNYYLWGAMGAAALVGLGLAQGQRERPVVVVTGDGEALMGLGGLATIGVARPTNLVVAVVDNGRYGETGMQTSHTGCGLDLAAVAAACGFAESATLTTLDQIERVALRLETPAEGPRFYAIKVAPENPPRSLPVRDAVHVKNRFRAHLGLTSN